MLHNMFNDCASTSILKALFNVQVDVPLSEHFERDPKLRRRVLGALACAIALSKHAPSALPILRTTDNAYYRKPDRRKIAHVDWKIPDVSDPPGAFNDKTISKYDSFVRALHDGTLFSDTNLAQKTSSLLTMYGLSTFLEFLR